MMARKIGLLGMVLVAAACSVGGNFEVRSGTVDDADVEEPLSDQAKQFSGLLEVSNEIVAKWRDGHVEDVYETYFSDALKRKVSLQDVRGLRSQTESKAGPFKSFKPMQWAFREYKGSDGSRVKSNKIVHHERGIVNYLMVFENAKSKKLIGLHFNAPK